MSEYTFADLIINPEAPNLESLIGKEVYFNDVPTFCIRNANDDYMVGILMGIHKEESAPFYVEAPSGCMLNYACIIPKKEESEPEYVPFESKEEFVEKYMQIKEGVAFGPFEDNLLQCGMWLKEKGTDSDVYCTVTEIWKEGVSVGQEEVFLTEGAVSTDFTSWRELCMEYTFLDGSPCGKLIEAEHE